MPNNLKEMRQWVNTIENRLIVAETTIGLQHKLLWIIVAGMVANALKYFFGGN